MRLTHRVKRIERALAPPVPVKIAFTREQIDRAQRMIANWHSDPVRGRKYLDLLEQARREIAARSGGTNPHDQPR